MTNTLGAKPVVDTTSFSSNIKQMNSELRVLESGFKAAAAGMGDWSNTATGLESRMKTLTASIDIQKQKVETTRAEWERVKGTHGENSIAANKLETDLNKQTETLNKMEGELTTTDHALQDMKGGTNETGDAVEEMGSQEEKTTGHTEALKTALAGVGAIAKAAAAAALAVAAAAAATVTAIAGLVFSSAEAADKLQDLSAQTGISVESLQEMEYIGGQVGVSLDTITGAQARLVRSMSAGRDGTGDQAKAFAELGVSVTDAQGNLRSTQDVFKDTIDALGKIQNPAERDALSMSLFGKSAQELNPLIKEGSKGMEEMAAKAHDLGAVMSDKDVSSLAEFSDMLQGLKDGLKGTLGTLATAFLPTFTLVFGTVGDILKEFKNIVGGADGDFGKMADGLGGLVGKIAAKISEQAPQMLEAGLGILKGLLNAILSALPTMLTAASEILKSLVGFISAALPQIIPAAISILLMLVNTIISNLPLLISAALMAIIALANGLSAALPELIPSIISAMLTIVQALTDNLPMLVAAALNLIVALAEGIAAALPLLADQGPTIIKALIVVIIASLPLLLKAAGQIIMTLARGLADSWLQAIPSTWEKMSEQFLASMGIAVAQWAINIYQAGLDIVSKIAEGLNTAYDVGSNFINGIWDGIDGNIDWLLGKVGGFAQSIIDKVKNILFGSGGDLLPLNGAGGDLPSLGGLLSSAQGGLAAATQSISSEYYTFYGPMYVGDRTGKTLGKQIKGRIF